MPNIRLNRNEIKLITTVSKEAKNLGSQTYVVGGAVRSWLLRQSPADIDVVCFGATSEVVSRVAKRLKSHLVVLDQNRQIFRVPLPGGQVLDITSGGASLEENASKRDFTMNALYVHLGRGNKVIIDDPLGGLSDLQNRKLRVISAQTFQSDPLRLLRAFRLCVEFDFEIYPSTLELIIDYAHLISLCAPERLHDEWARICRGRSSKVLPLMAQCGILTELFPMLKETQDFLQSPPHYWSVFEHSYRCVMAVDYLLGQGEWLDLDRVNDHPYLDEEVETILRSSAVALKTAALLHDIGKPSCCSREEEQSRTRFIGHPAKGEELCRAILPNLRFNKKEIAQICAMVRDHMRPSQLAAKGQVPTAKAVFRFFKDNPYATEILYLSLADHLATSGPNLDLAEWKAHNEMVRYVILLARSQQKRLIQSIPIKGNEIINHLHIPPSSDVALALREAHAAQAEGADRHEALRRAEMALKFARRQCEVPLE